MKLSNIFLFALVHGKSSAVDRRLRASSKGQRFRAISFDQVERDFSAQEEGSDDVASERWGGSAVGDPHFIISGKGLDSLCFNYTPDLTSGWFSNKGNLTVHHSIIGNDKTIATKKLNGWFKTLVSNPSSEP